MEGVDAEWCDGVSQCGADRLAALADCLLAVQVLTADNAAFKGQLPEAVAPAVLATQETNKFTHILAPSSGNFFIAILH